MGLELRHTAELPENKSVPVGCIGAGFIMSDCHLVAYREAGFNPVAITAIDLNQAEEAAERHSIKQVHDSVDRLLEDNEV